MPLTDLNHFLLRANDVEKTKQFYCDAMGLHEMPRPTFPFPGYWLGRDGKIWVHLAQHGVKNSDLYYKGSPPNAALDNTGVIDHVAFGATHPEEFRDHLTKLGCTWWARSFPEFNLFQIFVDDPDGLTIELNFYNMTTMPDWAENYGEMPSVV